MNNTLRNRVYGSCDNCGKEFKPGDIKVLKGVVAGPLRLLSPYTSVAGMVPNGVRTYCDRCAKAS